MVKSASVADRVCAWPALPLLEDAAAELLLVDGDEDDDVDAALSPELPPQADSSATARARVPAAAARRTWTRDTGTSRTAGGRRRTARPAGEDPARLKQFREAR